METPRGWVDRLVRAVARRLPALLRLCLTVARGLARGGRD